MGTIRRNSPSRGKVQKHEELAMLVFQGERQRYCDGISRRGFLRVGGLAIGGGLTLPNLLRAEASAGSAATKKSIINIFLPGGPPHIDTFDLKPEAPKEYRGEFQPIRTNVSGVEICELMPQLAAIADHYTIIRSIRGLRDEHTPTQSDSGWSQNDLRSIGGRPGVASVMAKVLGTSHPTPHGAAPTSVDITGWTRPGFLGQTYAAYRPDGEARQNLTLNRISEERLSDRTSLLRELDRMKRDVDSSGMMDAVDGFTGRAVELITSGELAKALDLSKEDPQVRARYGIDKQRDLDRFLLARRLIQAGVRCVALAWGGWDTHGQNFQQMRRQLPRLDQALAALIEDLRESGCLDDTIIMMSGEFGRTPRINGGAGRDHWAPASFFFLAGGGFRHGQVIGATNRLGEVPSERPVHVQHVFHTVYRQLGIDPDVVQLHDPNGRPQYLLDERDVIQELV